MTTKQKLIDALDNADVLDDILKFYNDGNGAEQTMNNIGDAVHFILEQLSLADEGDCDQEEENLLENIYFNKQRFI